MTLENQQLHLDNERLEAENAGLKAELERFKAELDGLAASYYEDMSDCMKTLVTERDEARSEVVRLAARCNRMVAPAPIEDATWRPS